MRKMFATKVFSNWIYPTLRKTLQNPKYRWWIVLGSLIYLLSPFDIVPDFLPIAGWIDDGLLATIVIAEVSQFMSDRLKTQKHQPDVATSNPDVVDVKAVTVS